MGNAVIKLNNRFDVSMEDELEAAKQDVRSVYKKIAQTEQDLAAAKQAQNKEREKSLSDLLLSLINLLTISKKLHFSLQEQKNISSRQAPSKHGFSLHILAR